MGPIVQHLPRVEGSLTYEKGWSLGGQTEMPHLSKEQEFQCVLFVVLEFSKHGTEHFFRKHQRKGD